MNGLYYCLAGLLLRAFLDVVVEEDVRIDAIRNPLVANSNQDDRIIVHVAGRIEDTGCCWVIELRLTKDVRFNKPEIAHDQCLRDQKPTKKYTYHDDERNHDKQFYERKATLKIFHFCISLSGVEHSNTPCV